MPSAPPKPELPDRVPEKHNALTPDLPPLGPVAPDIPNAAADRPRPGSHKKDTREDIGEERPPAGPGNTEPQEPTD
ncbi:hypothetical protein [Streptomyces sp. A0592]|uniref:hypothetical protein n=1 Tax=Streptomyces sp. A0592 TaxID=2563099 RepID=UPI00109E6AA7|nr:hypothetical protein [Streptomyces sp. A0592]THA81240.1 hypothetical protein E6U81_25750 [Streptomyces sp. A0592]